MGKQTGSLFTTSVQPCRTPAVQIETTSDHGAEDKTTNMMTNIIPLVIKDVFKVKICEDFMLRALCLLLPIGAALTTTCQSVYC